MTDLNPLEARLVDACREGTPLICAPGTQQAIRAEVIRGLCLGLRSDWRAPRGVRVKGARILGQLDLDGGEVPEQLILDECVADAGINLCFSRVFLIDLTRCRLGPVVAARMFVRHNLILGAADIRDRLDLR